MNPEIFFQDNRGSCYDEAKAVCVRCPVREECLEYALASNEHDGCWGCMSPRERSNEKRNRQKRAKRSRERERATVG